MLAVVVAVVMMDLLQLPHQLVAQVAAVLAVDLLDPQ
jgi:hypothetical protein